MLTVPLLQLLASPAENTQEKAAADIESLGLGYGIAGYDRQRLPADDAKRKTLELLARRLSCRVTQIDVEPADAQGGFKPRRMHSSGKSLMTKSFNGVLKARSPKISPRAFEESGFTQSAAMI